MLDAKRYHTQARPRVTAALKMQDSPDRVTAVHDSITTYPVIDYNLKFTLNTGEERRTSNLT